MVLTAEQRARVQALTGVALASVVVPDETGALAQAMPRTDPREIELLALAEARRQAATRGADEQMRAALSRAIADIEEQGMGEVRELLDKLKADPTWLGGLLHKK